MPCNVPGLAVLGLLAAAAATRIVESVLFGVTPADPLTFTAVAAVLLGVALLACWLPARRGARIDRPARCSAPGRWCRDLASSQDLRAAACAMASSIASRVTGASGLGSIPLNCVTGAVTGATRRQPSSSGMKSILSPGFRCSLSRIRLGQGHLSLAGDRCLHFRRPVTAAMSGVWGRPAAGVSWARARGRTR